MRILLLSVLLSTHALADDIAWADRFEGCPLGQVKTAATKGACCWPGQTSTDGRTCTGVPTRCPRRFTWDAGARECRLSACEPGQVRASNGLDCCWQGQAWHPDLFACVGVPTCPAGMTRIADGCFARCPANTRRDAWKGPVPKEMVAIAGTCVNRMEEDSRRVSPVVLSPFLIDRTEVTAGEYAKCVKSGACVTPKLWPGVDGHEAKYCNLGKPERARHPMNCLRHAEAEAYCTSVGKRLPTEAEWDYAARADDRRPHVGDLAPLSAADACWRRNPHAKSVPEKRKSTCPVASHPRDRSPFGLFDMTGNVDEWLFDIQAEYASTDLRDPRGPPARHLSRYTSVRGHSFVGSPDDTPELSSRASAAALLASYFRGFRCARGLPTGPVDPAAPRGAFEPAAAPPLDAAKCARGQVSVGQKCIGLPTRCPDGFDADLDQQRCARRCPSGQERSPDDAGCCWPGQRWEPSGRRCTGVPRCPAGFAAAGNACEPDCERAARRFAGKRPPGMVAIDGGCLKRELLQREGYPDRPASTHVVAPFAIDRSEVTVLDYAKCVERGRCLPSLRNESCNAGVRGREEHPINCVSWFDARDYCAFVGKRLPTLDEWELAARGPDSRAYPWGDAEPDDKRVCWSGSYTYGQGHRDGTCAVMSRRAGATPSGIYDLAGNVREWLVDEHVWWHDLDLRWREHSRFTAGGDWTTTTAEYLRPTIAESFDPGHRGYLFGIRCVSSP